MITMHVSGADFQYWKLLGTILIRGELAFTMVSFLYDVVKVSVQ